MVINKHGDHLYNSLTETLRKHLQYIAEVVVANQGETFLRELKLRWDHHNKSMQMIRDILMVLLTPLVPSRRNSSKSHRRPSFIFPQFGVPHVWKGKSMAPQGFWRLQCWMLREQTEMSSNWGSLSKGGHDTNYDGT